MKKLTVLILSLFVLISGQIVSSQTANKNGSRNINEKSVGQTDDPDFYQAEFLENDYKQVDVVAYVNVKERTLIDFIGKGDCEDDKGTGYCLYRLKADLKEVFKGKIRETEIEFYTSPDADYPKKNLMGEKVVFLESSDNSPDKKSSLGALENSTRSIEYDILKKMRKIAGKKS